MNYLQIIADESPKYSGEKRKLQKNMHSTMIIYTDKKKKGKIINSKFRRVVTSEPADIREQKNRRWAFPFHVQGQGFARTGHDSELAIT